MPSNKEDQIINETIMAVVAKHGPARGGRILAASGAILQSLHAVDADIRDDCLDLILKVIRKADDIANEQT